MSDTETPNDPHSDVENSVTKNDPASEPNKEPATRVGSGVGLVDAQEEQRRAAEAREQRQQWWKSRREWLAIGISIAAFCVSFGSCYESNRSASIAERSLNTTVENFRMDQRARVGLIRMDPPTEIREGAKWGFKATVINSGKTSALNMRCIIHMRAMLKGDPFAPVYVEETPPTARPSVATLVSGARTFPTTPERVLKKVESDGFSRGETIVYVYGEISYDDAFGRPHCTTYCLSYTFDFSRPIICETYNGEADTKCENIKE